MFVRALGDVDSSGDPAVDDGTIDFDVIGYRGGIVASEDAWRADATSRGGVITQVPGGTWVDAKCARFGDASPYTYELAPLWILIAQGIQEASDANTLQMFGIAQGAANMAQGVAKATGAVVSALPDLVKWVAIGGLAILGIELMNYVPRRRNA